MDTVLACGIDIVEVPRIRALCERHGDRFLRRVWAAGERSRASGLPDPATFLAGRFAAKEAVLKVLGCGIFSGIPLPEIEIGAHESGEPYCVLAGEAQRRARSRGVDRILLSISHTGAYAVAQAIGIGAAKA